MKIATVKNSLEEKMKFYDFTKLANQDLLEVAFLTLGKFIEKYKILPKSWSEEDFKKY